MSEPSVFLSSGCCLTCSNIPQARIMADPRRSAGVVTSPSYRGHGHRLHIFSVRRRDAGTVMPLPTTLVLNQLTETNQPAVWKNVDCDRDFTTCETNASVEFIVIP